MRALSWFGLGLLFACQGSEGTLVVSERDGGRPLLDPAQSFQLQLTGALDTGVEADVFIVDLDASSAALAELHAADRRTVCFFSAGSLEPFRDDARDLSDAVRGNPLDDYPDERWLDIASDEVRALMLARLERARTLGCSGVSPANLDIQLEDSGFGFDGSDAAAYGRWLADEAHARGLPLLLSSDGLASDLADSFDGALAFACVEDDGCAHWAAVSAAGKALWVVEVGDAESAPELCARARELDLNVIVKDSDYGAFRIACR